MDSPDPTLTPESPFVVVDTDQKLCFTTDGCTTCQENGTYVGQDAQYDGVQPAYQHNWDGTVTDTTTGLMWQKNPGTKMTWDEAVEAQESFELAGYTDWRLPTIKELYSLILFSGRDVSGCPTQEACSLIPFIDTTYFDFAYGDTTVGERVIDSQYLSSTRYVSTTMVGDETAFGVNFADGRIKGYGLTLHGSGKTFFVGFVRGNPDYGENLFADNGDDTLTDFATGLMWMQTDSGHDGAGEKGDGALDWEHALAWCESTSHAGQDDWRLPNAKELQSIVDYTRSPSTTGSAAIDPLFAVTEIVDEGGSTNYPFYWTSTTHAGLATSPNPAGFAVYVAFGQALGWMQTPMGTYELLDVHGAGAQRSDPKQGDPTNYPRGNGPQGDIVRIYNHARCVRGGDTAPNLAGRAECASR